MRRIGSMMLAVLLGLQAAMAVAEPADAVFVKATERAIAGGRLIQAEAMLGRSDTAIAAAERSRLEATLLLAQHRDHDALDRFQALLAQQPADCRLQTGAGIAALRLDQRQDAEPHLRAATTACPDRADAWGALAVLEDREQRWDLSRAAYAHAITLDRDSPALLNNAGVSLLAQKRFDEAGCMFKQVLLLDPADETAKNNLDIALVASGARPSFSAEDDSRRKAERLNNAGYAALLAGDSEAATNYFSDAVKTDPFRFETAETNLGDAMRSLRTRQ